MLSSFIWCAWIPTGDPSRKLSSRRTTLALACAETQARPVTTWESTYRFPNNVRPSFREWRSIATHIQPKGAWTTNECPRRKKSTLLSGLLCLRWATRFSGWVEKTALKSAYRKRAKVHATSRKVRSWGAMTGPKRRNQQNWPGCQSPRKENWRNSSISMIGSHNRVTVISKDATKRIRKPQQSRNHPPKAWTFSLKRPVKVLLLGRLRIYKIWINWKRASQTAAAATTNACVTITAVCTITHSYPGTKVRVQVPWNSLTGATKSASINRASAAPESFPTIPTSPPTSLCTRRSHRSRKSHKNRTNHRKEHWAGPPAATKNAPV
jgi:hypothetical protein